MAVCPIYFTDYEKITDTLLTFGKGKYCLKFNVKLASKKSKNDDSRISYHTETVYKMEKPYYDTIDEIGCSISRKVSNYYYSIEATTYGDKAYDNSIYIYPHDIYYIKYVFEQVLTWFDQNNDVFGKNPDYQYRVRKKVDPIRYCNLRFPEKYIDIIPEVMDIGDNKTSPGVVMYLNGDDNYIEMSIGEFFALYWIIVNTDMYGLVSSMLCYVKTRPYAANVGGYYNMNEDEVDDFWNRRN